jgi:hypothetical protein
LEKSPDSAFSSQPRIRRARVREYRFFKLFRPY